MGNDIADAQAETTLQDFNSIFRLDGKVAVVTGGSRGLGLHAASGLMQAGCAKVFITSRKAAACEAACQVLNALPNKSTGAVAIPIPADNSKPAEIERLVAEVRKHTEHVDILLANAGVAWGAEFDKHPIEGFAKVMDLNVKSVFYTIQKFTPLLQARATIQDPSRVIVTGSVAGIEIGEVLGAHGSYGYSASKAAVLHLARNLAIELGPRRILVNSIAPGFFPSKLANLAIESSGGKEELGKQNPNGRIGQPEDIAGAVVFLCSRAASHITAETLVIDGGKMIGRGKI